MPGTRALPALPLFPECGEAPCSCSVGFAHIWLQTDPQKQIFQMSVWCAEQLSCRCCSELGPGVESHAETLWAPSSLTGQPAQLTIHVPRPRSFPIINWEASGNARWGIPKFEGEGLARGLPGALGSKAEAPSTGSRSSCWRLCGGGRTADLSPPREGRAESFLAEIELVAFSADCETFVLLTPKSPILF